MRKSIFYYWPHFTLFLLLTVLGGLPSAQSQQALALVIVGTEHFIDHEQMKFIC
jgi:hypothetical protein